MGHERFENSFSGFYQEIFAAIHRLNDWLCPVSFVQPQRNQRTIISDAGHFLGNKPDLFHGKSKETETVNTTPNN